MGIFDDIFGDPSEGGARDYLDKIPGTVKPYYDPYINAGNQALPDLQKQYGNLINNPGDFINNIGSGYKKSPGYDFGLQQALQGANHAQAAGGMAGSPQHQQFAADISSQYANKDYNDYLQNALGAYGKGLQGEQDIFHTGYGASDSLANMLAQALSGQSGLSYSGKANQNQMSGDLIGSILGLFGGKR